MQSSENCRSYHTKLDERTSRRVEMEGYLFLREDLMDGGEGYVSALAQPLLASTAAVEKARWRALTYGYPW